MAKLGKDPRAIDQGFLRQRVAADQAGAASAGAGSVASPRARKAVIAMSPVTLPMVRKMSGITSTAIRIGKRSTGRPSVRQIGAMLAKNETWPGRLTEARLVATATNTAPTYCAALGWT